MPNRPLSQVRPLRGPGNATSTPREGVIEVPQHGYSKPIRFLPRPIVARDEHPERRREWQQLEDSHIRYGAAHALRAVGTSDLTGPERNDYQVKLGVGTQGQELLYRPDVILHAGWDSSKWILIEDKWQRHGGSCEDKILQVWTNLHHAISYDDRVVAAYLILDGPGWSETLLERFKLTLSSLPSPVKVFFSDDEFLRHGIPEAWTDPATLRPKTAAPYWGDSAQLRLA